jgi:hypothetical protein
MTGGSIKYLFNYLAHVHKDLTYRAARMAGLNPLASDVLSGATVMVDFQGPRVGGSMGVEFASQDVEHSHMHGMCAGGASTALCDLKVADFREKLWNMKSMAGLAGLLHLYQDSFAPGLPTCILTVAPSICSTFRVTGVRRQRWRLRWFEVQQKSSKTI